MKKLAFVFDLDGTIVPADTVFEFFGLYGKKERAEKIYGLSCNAPKKLASECGICIPAEKIYPGIDVEIVLGEIVEENGPIPLEKFEELALTVPLCKGAPEFFAKLRERYGGNIFIVSSTFQPLGRAIAKRLGLDEENVLATRLREEGGRVIGFLGPVMEAGEKEIALRNAAARRKLSLKDFVAVGDGSQDWYFMKAVADAGGLGIAVSANRELVRKAGPKVVMEAPDFGKIWVEIEKFACAKEVV